MAPSSRLSSPTPSASGSADFTSVHWSHPSQPPTTSSLPPAASSSSKTGPLRSPSPIQSPLTTPAPSGEAFEPVEDDHTARTTAGAYDDSHDDDEHAGGGHGWVGVRIVDYKKELEGGKESYVSYGLRTKVRGIQHLHRASLTTS